MKCAMAPVLLEKRLKHWIKTNAMFFFKVLTSIKNFITDMEVSGKIVGWLLAAVVSDSS